jgi:hypothetical protein
MISLLQSQLNNLYYSLLKCSVHKTFHKSRYNVLGGTGAYTYAVVTDNCATPQERMVTTQLSRHKQLANLSWDVYVKDANGCIAMQNVTVVSDAHQPL